MAESKVKRAVDYLESLEQKTGEQKLREKAVLLGDTVHDYEVAQELGIDCVLFTCGHQDRKSLKACGCPVYDSPRALLYPS